MGRDKAREEFDRFVADSSDGLVRTAYLLVWDLAAAEDLVQECLWRVARRWPRVRSMEFPSAYARRILVNLALDGAKRRHRHRLELDQRHRCDLDDRQDDRAAQALGAVDASSELIAAVGELAPRQRATLVLRYFDDLSEIQVAEILGCSVGTVKSTSWRALERLRQLLAPAQAGGNDLDSKSGHRHQGS
jgi:RNA polymerase sigma-70 factor (sigma-E family)